MAVLLAGTFDHQVVRTGALAAARSSSRVAGHCDNGGRQLWKVLLPVGLALFLANGALWLLRGFDRLR